MKRVRRNVYAAGVRASEMPLPQPRSSAVDGGEIKIDTPGVRRPRRRMFRFMGHVRAPGYAPICGDTNDPHTIWCGLTKRLCRDLPKPDIEMQLRFKQYVKDFLNEFLGCSEVMDFEDWLESTTYTLERKEELRRVWWSLRGGLPTKKQMRKVKSFGKTEAYAVLKFIRLINSRSDAVKVFMGPRAKAVENIVYKLKEFIKHVPVTERPACLAGLRRAGRRYFLSDYTAFESHFISSFMDICECQLYRHVLRNDKHVEVMCDIMKGWSVLKTATGVRCLIKGRRMSGEMTTSVGNGFSNLMLALFVTQMRHGDYNVKNVAKYIDGYVEGDDGIFSTDIEITEEDFAKLGFTCKLVEVNDPCECLPAQPVENEDLRFGRHAGAFCGVCCSKDGQIIRDPRAFLSTFGWTSSFVNAGQAIMDELSVAKALSALYETRHCPIVAPLARYILKKLKATPPRFIRDGYHELPTWTAAEALDASFAPSGETRELFARHFGISANQQLKIEELISRGEFEQIPELMPPLPDMAWYEARFVEAA